MVIWKTKASQRSLVHVVLVKLDFRLGFLGLFGLLLGTLAQVEVHRRHTRKCFAYEPRVRLSDIICYIVEAAVVRTASHQSPFGVVLLVNRLWRLVAKLVVLCCLFGSLAHIAATFQRTGNAEVRLYFTPHQGSRRPKSRLQC